MHESKTTTVISRNTVLGEHNTDLLRLLGIRCFHVLRELLEDISHRQSLGQPNQLKRNTILYIHTCMLYSGNIWGPEKVS